MQKFEFTKEEIVQDLRKLGIEEGDTVLVHSSLSSIGYVPGGAETVVDALLKSVGENGTIIAPTITGQIFDSPENPPNFSFDKPCWTGTIPETLRKRKEAYRSKHPTHSVAAIGKFAKSITEGHENSKTPCGEGTPYLKVPDLGGKILFLGATLESNTTFHSVEELARLYYHLQPEPSLCKVEVNGQQIERRYFLHAYGTPRSFGEKEEELVDNKIAKTGYVGRARSILVDAKAMIKFTLEKIKENRLYLVKVDHVDLWSISSSLRLIQEGKFNSIKINLYVPKGATIRFSGNNISIKGVKMNMFNLNLLSCMLEVQANVVNDLDLNGGYNYWLEFKKVEGGTRVDILEFKDSASFFNF